MRPEERGPAKAGSSRLLKRPGVVVCCFDSATHHQLGRSADDCLPQ